MGASQPGSYENTDGYHHIHRLCGKVKCLVDDADTEQEDTAFPEYTPEKFLEEVYMDADCYDTLVELVRMKKNVILQGAPGVGKTVCCKTSGLFYDGM